MKLLTGFLLPFSLAAPLAASTVLPVDFGRLSRIAAQVVNGEVVHMESSRNADNGYIYTNVTLKLRQALPARFSAAEYSFRMIGGEADGQRLFIADMPKFEVGDEVILFLNRQPAGVMGPTVGLWQGVFFVERDKRTGAASVVDYQRRPVLDVQDGNLVRGPRVASSGAGVALSEGALPTPMSPTSFLEQVRRFRVSTAAAQ